MHEIDHFVAVAMDLDESDEVTLSYDISKWIAEAEEH